MSFFRLGDFFDENFGIPLAPQVHMLQYRDHSGYRWIQLIQNNLFFAKICCGHQSNFRWLDRSYFIVTPSCKVPYFHSNLCVVTLWTAGCGLCFLATSVSGTVAYIRALWYAFWCMGGWLVLGLHTSYCTSHIMNSTNPWIHLLNEFIYYWKSPISLSAQSCAVLVAIWYLTHPVIFPSVHISSACMYICSMYQASKMAQQLVWFELCCVEILVWCEMCCVELPLWHL